VSGTVSWALESYDAGHSFGRSRAKRSSTDTSFASTTDLLSFALPQEGDKATLLGVAVDQDGDVVGQGNAKLACPHGHHAPAVFV
jgi:hypothetical protein